MEEKAIDQDVVQEIKRYLHKIVQLKTCYTNVMEHRDIWTLIEKVMFLFMSPDCEIMLRNVACEVKELSKTNPYHAITLHVASDSINHLTNDFIRRSGRQKELFKAVNQVRQEVMVHTISTWGSSF